MIRLLFLLLLPGILFAQEALPIFVPAGGNTWLLKGADQLTNDGVVNWSDAETQLVIYVRLSPGDL